MSNIALIGPRCSGKSTLGPELAVRLERAYVDTDAIVAGRFEEPTISAIWSVHGEAGWRRMEEEVLSVVLAGDGQIISMGGGLPILPAAQDQLREQQDAGRLFVAYLDVPLEVLRDRMASGQGDRPSLTGADPIEEAEAVTRDRDPVYRSLADATCSIPAGESMADSLERLAGMLKEAR